MHTDIRAYLLYGYDDRDDLRDVMLDMEDEVCERHGLTYLDAMGSFSIIAACVEVSTTLGGMETTEVGMDLLQPHKLKLMDIRFERFFSELGLPFPGYPRLFLKVCGD
jgi:hypothetical protein